MADILHPPSPPTPRYGDYSARERQTLELLVRANACSEPCRRNRLLEQAAVLNQSMALGIARRYHGRGVDDEDIDQVALLALWKAVMRYRATEGGAGRQGKTGESPTTFAAFAIPTITGEIKRYFRDHGWLVRPTRVVQEQTLAIGHATTALCHQLGREPQDEELAAFLGLTPRDLDRARQAHGGYHARSLDTPQHGTTQTLANVLPDAQDHYDRVDTILTLRCAIERLPDRDRRLLQLRYDCGLTQSDIARRLGVSQMHVSRLLSRIHRRLRDSVLSV